jgi:threonine dehydratase
MKLGLKEIQDAELRVGKFLQPTRLLRCEPLEKELQFQGKLFLKCDQEQPTGSFKVRGAFNVLCQLTKEERARGVVTRSSGNFAQAVAYASQKLGVAATIVMPRNAPKTKLEGTKHLGATVIQQEGDVHEEGEKIVEDLVKEKGYVLMHPYNNYRTMAGQGTAALEVLQQLPEVDHFFCPIGGGGLMSGCATAFKETSKKIKTYGVEPAGAGDYHASRLSGKHETWEHIDTIADGLRASSVGELNYPILNKYVDESLVVGEDEIKRAMRWLYEKMGIVTEPSGAVAFAGFFKEYQNLQGNVVIFLSGQNVDRDKFDLWIV